MAKSYDIIVVGSGNAGLCAAISAAESLSAGGKVLLIDKCPENYAGGNGWYTPGRMRARHNGSHDLLTLVTNLDPDSVSIDAYTAEDFHADLYRTTSGRYERGIGNVLVEYSASVLRWMAQHGVRFRLDVDPAAPIGPDGKRILPPSTYITTVDGGRGLISDLLTACGRLGVEIQYRTSAREIVLDESGAFQSLIVERLPPATEAQTVKEGSTAEETISAHAVILAAGGYEASTRLLTEHHGPGFASAAVRGTPYNNGEVLEMVLKPPIYGKRTGDWDTVHCSVWDADAPLAGGDRTRLADYVKCDFAPGITMNVKGQRFFDEGLDTKLKIYSRFARAIAGQPGGIAFQVWDAKAAGKLTLKEYGGSSEKGRIRGNSLRELAECCAEKGLEDIEQFVKTVEEYNAPCHGNLKDERGKEVNFSEKDGLNTGNSLAIPKSNWAMPLDQAPFEAYRVRCGITFTFGGVAIDPETAGLLSDRTGMSVPGIFCCGEMVGGLFYGGQANGSGLTAGALFGRVAGRSAADHVRSRTG